MIEMDAVPVKTAEAASQEGSPVVLLMPRYPTIAGRLVGKLFRRSKHIRVKLDDLGTAVWQLIDGKRSVRHIGEEIEKTFGEEAQPLYPRLGEFLGILAANRFIRLVKPCEVNSVD